MKKTIIYLFLLLSYTALSASSYKIKDAEYNLEGSRSEFTGITREYALKTKVPLDFKRIFSDEEELMQYIHDVKQQIENTRNFDKVDVDFSVSEPDESDICNVFLIISTHDSMHFIAAPYPKYSSGDSLNLTVKVKDTNFLGSMETMTGEGKFAMELNDDDSVKDYLLGLGLDFETPFELLVAVILSAQCTDDRVNKVTPILFKVCSTPEEFSAIPIIKNIINNLFIY